MATLTESTAAGHVATEGAVGRKETVQNPATPRSSNLVKLRGLRQ